MGNWRAWPRLIALVLACALASGCSVVGPRSLKQARQQYNEIVKVTSEEELLLNIVRLRYVDTPSSMAVSNIAAQFELVSSLQITPFFVASGAEVDRSYTKLLPQAGVAGADRPTFSLTPLDESEFARKLFTPITLEAVIYLAKTTWPISTVFRLYLENLNWVPNAELASGPTPRVAPPYEEFLSGVNALQSLQDRGQVVFGLEDQDARVGGPLPAASVTAADVLAATKEGYEYRPDADGRTWTLFKRVQKPLLRVDPQALESPEMEVFARTFRLKRGLTKYPISQEALDPFPATFPAEGVTHIDLETRSLLQGLFYLSLGVEVPPDHIAQGIARATLDHGGQEFDWRGVTAGLFHVHWAAGGARPPGAHVAVPYRGYWFYINAADHETKSTFTLLMELSRLNFSATPAAKPVLTLPLGR